MKIWLFRSDAFQLPRAVSNHSQDHSNTANDSCFPGPTKDFSKEKESPEVVGYQRAEMDQVGSWREMWKPIS